MIFIQSLESNGEYGETRELQRTAILPKASADGSSPCDMNPVGYELDMVVSGLFHGGIFVGART
jgi:hypothetical protein